MNINWKVRVKNPVWWVQVGIAIVTPILAYIGLGVSDLTSWGIVWDMIVEAVGNPYLLGLIAVSVWNTLNDPTTPGISDSERALSYVEPGIIEDIEDV